MKMSFRWYGESDPVSLEYISQIPGMRSIVSAVYDVKPGEVWPEESLAKMKKQCEDHGLVFDVVESIPVSEDIKLGRANRDELLEVYCENIRRCAKYGVKCVTYNFMPVFDWTRTQLDKKAADGSTSLVMYWDQLKGLDPLTDDINLPGWDASYTRDEIKKLFVAYGELGEEGLWKNLEIFLKKVMPVAEECGVVMAIHPDDPPYPIFGLPRIITCEENLDRMLAMYDSPANSLCLCTGSLGCAAFNNVPALVRKYSAMGRIGFMHIRNVKIMEDGSFEERAHLSGCGSLDMYEIVNALVETGFDGYVRPDHGRMIWGERANRVTASTTARWARRISTACSRRARKRARSNSHQKRPKRAAPPNRRGRLCAVTASTPGSPQGESEFFLQIPRFFVPDNHMDVRHAACVQRFVDKEALQFRAVALLAAVRENFEHPEASAAWRPAKPTKRSPSNPQ